jgi:hypothetical protein
MEQMRLDMQSRREILKANFEEYQKASKKGRTELLDRLVPVTGLNRSYLAAALGNDRVSRGGPGSGIRNNGGNQETAFGSERG